MSVVEPPSQQAKVKISDMNPSRLVNYLYATSTNTNLSGQELYVNMHPALQDLGVKLVQDKYHGTNQITVAILLAVKEVIRQFKTKGNTKYHQQLIGLIRDEVVPYIEKCKRLFSGTKYALVFIRNKITKLALKS